MCGFSSTFLFLQYVSFVCTNFRPANTLNPINAINYNRLLQVNWVKFNFVQAAFVLSIVWTWTKRPHQVCWWLMIYQYMKWLVTLLYSCASSDHTVTDIYKWMSQEYFWSKFCISSRSSTIAVLYLYKLCFSQLLHILNVFTYVHFSFSWMSSWFKLWCSICTAEYQHDSKELFHISADRQIPSFSWRLTLWIHMNKYWGFLPRCRIFSLK